MMMNSFLQGIRLLLYPCLSPRWFFYSMKDSLLISLLQDQLDTYNLKDEL